MLLSKQFYDVEERSVGRKNLSILNTKEGTNRCHLRRLNWLFVFSTERMDKGSDDRRVHTRAHLLRGMYLLSIGAARNTHLYALMSTFTRTLGES